jgi:hypothetical protein
MALRRLHATTDVVTLSAGRYRGSGSTGLMRNLIRMSLFILARLGLFFPALTWTFSLWQHVTYIAPSPGGTIAVGLHSRGLVFVRTERLVPSAFEFSSPDESNIADWAFEEPRWRHPDFGTRLNYGFVCGGSVYAGYSGLNLVAVQHWLLVGLFALFYVSLKLFYRNRPRSFRESLKAE